MDLLLTYDKYTSLGGTITESTFNVLNKRAQAKLNYLTNNRISNLETIPEEVYEVLTEMINFLNVEDTNRDPSITSYNNGIESFGYNTSKDAVTIDTRLRTLVNEYLAAYPELLYRGRWQWKQQS